MVKREDKPTSSKPSAPFITSTLQQAASNRLGFGVKKTMMMAQRLYEAGYITLYAYRLDQPVERRHRDGARLHLTRVRPEIPAAKAEPVLQQGGRQEAHEAIRPSDVNLRPTQLSGMERDAERLYELIWRQFVARQMPPAEYLSTSVCVAASGFELRAKGRILKFDGYTRVLPQQSKPGEDDVLPEMKEGEAPQPAPARPQPALPSRRRASPKPAWSGTGKARHRPPSTYAAIISTIQERGYVTVHKPSLLCREDGRHRHRAPRRELRQPDGLRLHRRHGRASGRRGPGRSATGSTCSTSSAGDFKKKLEVAETADKGMRANQPTPTDIACRDRPGR